VWHGTGPVERALPRGFDAKQKAMLRTLEWQWIFQGKSSLDASMALAK
jgi:hypothetical protein